LDSIRGDRFEHPEPIQYARCIRSKLDAGSDLFECRGPFKDMDR
jgi:hypothetical protein